MKLLLIKSRGRGESWSVDSDKVRYHEFSCILCSVQVPLNSLEQKEQNHEIYILERITWHNSVGIDY